MSFWDSFLNTFKQRESGRNFIGDATVGLGKAVAALPGALLNELIVDPLIKEGQNRAQKAGRSPEDVAAVGQALQQSKIGKYSQEQQDKFIQGSVAGLDPILRVAEKAEKYVFSPLARGISTANLLQDPSSPLYNDEKYGKGVQLSDIRDAWNRSADVSLGQSIIKNQFSLIGLANSAILDISGMDMSEVNLWDDESVQKNFVDNPLGEFISGWNDFIIKNVAIGAAVAGTGAIAKAGAIRAGLTTKFKASDVDAMPLFEKDMTDHINFISSGGVSGTRTVIGQDVIDLAASDNIVDIVRIVKKHSYNSALPDLLKTTKDPAIVRDLLLADKGYGPAIERLSTLRMSDDLWVLGDATAVIRGKYITEGGMPVYTAAQRARWTAAFDDAIAKNPKHQEIYDAFLREELDEATGLLNTEVLALGKNYKPMEPIVGRGVVGAARSRAGQIKTASMERDFVGLGGVAETVLGGRMNGPITVLMRQFGTFMPKGIVTNSGLRPMNGIDELMAVFDDIPLFRNGSRVVETHTREMMPASAYRRQVIDRFVSAKTDGERALVIDSVNKEIARTLAFSRGYYDVKKIDDMVDELMSEIYKVHSGLRKEGFAMDPQGVRVQVDIRTQRQLANSMPMLPLGEFDRMILRLARSEKNAVLGGATAIQQGTAAAARAIFEGSSRIFSAAQLYRFSYIPKNSVFEPLLAASLSEGTAFAGPMFTTAIGSMIQKSRNIIARNVEKSTTLLPGAKREIQREVKALSDQYNQAILNRDIIYATYESHFGVGLGVSPAAKRDWADDIKIRLKDAEKDVAAIESRLNVYANEYGTPISVPSIYNLRRRIETLKSFGKKTEQTLPTTFDEVLKKNPNITETGKDTMALVKTDFVKKFMEFDRTARGYDIPGYSTETIAKISTDLKSGKGFTDPLILDYWVDKNGNLLLNLTEGNHRLAAAIDAGINEVPIKILKGYQSQISKGKPAGKSVIKPDFSGYIPGNVNPKNILPSIVVVVPKASAEANLAARYASEIAAAERTLARAVEDINTMAPELNIITAEIAKAYDKIGKAIDEIGPVGVRQADLFEVSEARYAKQPLLAETQNVQLSNGQTLEFPSFANRSNFGEGYMSEIANNATRTLEFLGNKASVARTISIRARSPKSVTNVADPTYFDELAFVVNNQMRGDLLVDRILSGQSREQLLQWATTGQGKFYTRQMGKTPDEVIKMVDDQIIFVQKYLPTYQARQLALKGEVTPSGLRRELSEYLDQMSPIHPLDVEYSNASLMGNTGAAIDAALAKTWRGLMKPENAIREVWGTSRHRVIVAERAERLLAQGQTIDVSTLNTIHHAAAIEVVDEVAKVFYTIPRQHRALYLARGLATFPNAAASGIYRYSRFAVKKSPRFGGFLNSYYGLYNSFGVDENGNPVDDPMKAKYLLVPGTKQMGLNNGKGIIINSRATNYVANFPGASWIVPIALSKIYSSKPNTEDEIKKMIDSTFGKIPGYSYEELFPYGIEPDTVKQLTNTFTPAWARNLIIGMSADKTNKMFVDSWISESNRQWILYDMGKGPKPTDKSVVAGAKSIYLRKARTQFFSILGTPQYVESRPDGLYRDYYYGLVNEYQLKGKNITEASKLAEEDFQKYMQAETGSEFPMERLFVSSQDSLTYITPSQKAYDRIWENFPGLATKLRQIDPSVIGLMVADLPKEYSPQVNKFLNSTMARFPDGTMVNSALKTPELVEEEIEKSRFWAAYTAQKKVYNEAAKAAGYKSYLSVPDLKEKLKDYAENTLGKDSFAWFQEYQKSATKGNQAWIQTQGLATVVKDKEFMNKYGKTQFWQHAKAFVQYRGEYVAAYKDAPTGTKGKVKDAWSEYLASSYDMWDPVLQRMITRYFENDNLRENK
jgi:hypothetical protein